MNIALYGGSFDPPHIAHQLVCLYILSTQDVDEVWFLPCYQHPFGKKSADFSHRLEMCKLAATELAPRVKICDIEAELPRPSYTLHTVEALQKKFPQHRFFWVIGEDVLPNLSQWYNYEELQKKISFLVVGREGYSSTASLPLKMPQISSTLIRNLLHEGKSPQGLIPKQVLAYITAHRLYQES